MVKSNKKNLKSKSFLDYLKKDISPMILNKWFYFIIIFSILFLILSYAKGVPITFKTLSYLLFVGSILLYNLMVKIKDKYSNYIRWGYFIINAVAFVIYLAFMLKEVKLGSIIFIFSFYISLILLIGSYTIGLIKSKNIFVIILFYVILSLLLISSFSIIFEYLNDSPNSGLFYLDNTKVNNSNDVLYFSATNFYSSSLGEIYPVGKTRVVMVIELILSYILHIIILGLVINNIKKFRGD